MRRVLLLASTILNHLPISLGYPDEDYWSNDYDTSKNCESEDIIATLDVKAQCVENFIEQPNQAIDKCKVDLYRKAVSFCDQQSAYILNRGELLYCKDRAKTLCCFHNLECEENRHGFLGPMLNAAKEFLTDKEKYLEKEIAEGFKTCHPIQGYDATICRDDCKKLENSDFAKECQKKNGFLKCCIRRDKAYCDECRFCCTLPFCSYTPDGSDILLQSADFKASKEGDQKIKSSAFEKIYAYKHMLKSEDHRCLKPDSHPDPEQWSHYDPDSFINARTQLELDQAKSIKFDKNFFNFEDREVFDKATSQDPKVLQQFWKSTYGVDFAALYEEGIGGSFAEVLIRNENIQHLRAMEPCYKDCMREELTGSFARKCRARGGLFKCCTEYLKIFPFIGVRENLFAQGFLKTFKEDSCECGRVCIVSYICTTKNVYSGLVEQEYMTPDFNPLGGALVEVNGENKRIPFKLHSCRSTDTCAIRPFSIGSFLEASSKEELCSLKYHVVRYCHEITPQHKEQAKTIDLQKGIDIEKDNYVKKCVKEITQVKTCPKERMETFVPLSPEDKNCYSNSMMKMHYKSDLWLDRFKQRIIKKERKKKKRTKKRRMKRKLEERQGKGKGIKNKRENKAEKRKKRKRKKKKKKKKNDKRFK